MKFPEYRLRRLRKNENLRKLFSETKLSISDFVMPYFVIEGKNVKQEINSMPGIFRYSIDQLLKEVEEIYKLGILSVLLFGVPDRKDEIGSYAYSKDGIVQKAIKAIKKEIPDIVVITDVCLCSYTTHGHCGILKKRPRSMVNSPRSMVNSPRSMVNSQRKKRCGLWSVDHEPLTMNYGPWTMDYRPIDNDATLEVLAKIALSHAEAGADIVAPSAMMDGQVQVIRKIPDAGIKVVVGEGEVSFELGIVVEYGVNIPEVTYRVQNSIKEEVEKMTKLKVIKVDVLVHGVHLSDK